MSVIKVTTESGFNQELVSGIFAGRHVLVDFWATWCAPCAVLAPHVEYAAREHVEKVKFLSVDVDQIPNLARKYTVMSVPTLVLFGLEDGQTEILAHRSNIRTRSDIDRMLRPFLV